jgi:hypothetical protein
LYRNLPVYGLKTFAEQKAESRVSERLVATLSGFLGVLALLAATVLYGVLAYLVERRVFEIGIRMSLGASREHVLWMVLRGALAMAASRTCRWSALIALAVRTRHEAALRHPARRSRNSRRRVRRVDGSRGSGSRHPCVESPARRPLGRFAT